MKESEKHRIQGEHQTDEIFAYLREMDVDLDVRLKMIDLVIAFGFTKFKQGRDMSKEIYSKHEVYKTA